MSFEMEISAAQARLKVPVTPKSRRDFRLVARWWELEAKRGYASSETSLRYAANMRRAADLVGWFGEGTFAELEGRYQAAAQRELARKSRFKTSKVRHS